MCGVWAAGKASHHSNIKNQFCGVMCGGGIGGKGQRFDFWCAWRRNVRRFTCMWELVAAASALMGRKQEEEGSQEEGLEEADNT